MIQRFLPHTARALALVVLLAGTLPACAQQDAPRPDTPASPDDAATTPPPYAFDAPDATFELSKKLREISGLTFLDEQHLGAVQDEDGRLYILDAETGEIVRDEKFGNDGDYEGIERVGQRVFILRSDGDLYTIDDWQADDYDADKQETPFDSKHDTEGLAYDAAGNRLLIACKEYPGKNLKGFKAIYAYDLAAGEVIKTPVYTIATRDFSEEVPEDNALNQRIRNFVSPAWDLSRLRPSALAVHPATGEVYVLTSVRPAVVVLDAGGDLAGVWMLPKKVLPQPEGIAFAADGTLYIASEGAGGRAVLARYAYRPGS